MQLTSTFRNLCKSIDFCFIKFLRYKVLIGFCFLALCFIIPRASNAQVYNVNYQTVDFSNLQLLSGTALQTGARYYQENVINLAGTDIDVIVTIDQRSNVPATLTGGGAGFLLDQNATNPSRFQPEISAGTGGGFVDFKFEFFTDYTNPASKVSFIDFFVTIVDNDGNATMQEYMEVAGFSGYELDATTQISVLPGTRPGFTRFRGRPSNLPGVTFDNTASAIVEYSLELAEFNLRLGLTNTNNADRRQFSITVGSRLENFTTPVITQNPNLPSFPDLAVSYLNTVKLGSVKTNDRVTNYTYSNAIANGANPAGASFTLNLDGTYSFIATNPGVYRYTFDYCTPVAVGPPSCNQETIVIRAIDHTINTNTSLGNLPVANNDFAVTQANITRDINVLANDNPGVVNIGLTPNLQVTPTSAKGGSLSVVGGLVRYVPFTGFTGIDTFTYTITDNNGIVSSATVFVRVQVPSSTTNYIIATDDYRNLIQGTTATGNALTNDQQTLTTTALSVVGGPTVFTDASGNTLNIAANGAYTFTPTATFNGNTSFTYTTTGTSGATATATIHFTVAPFEVKPDLGSVLVNTTINGNLKTNDDVVFGTTYGTYSLDSSPGGASISFTGNADGTYSFSSDTPGTYVYSYQVCSPTNPNPPCKPSTLTITVTDPLSTTNPPIANPDIAATFADANPANPGVPVTINVVSNDQPGNSGNVIVPSTAALVGGPAGVANNFDGTFTYTPAAGFTGTFTFQYTVEDDEGRESSPATVTVTVYPDGSPNAVTVSDDYLTTFIGSPIVKNAANGLLANDSQLDTTDPLEATTGTFTNAGEGVLILAADGSYTFTPSAGFVGTTQFPYTVTGTDGAIASGTAYFTVSPRILPDGNVGFIDVSISGDVSSNDLVETGTTYGGISADGGNPNGNLPVLAADGKYTFITDTPGFYIFTYEVCAPSMTSPDCYIATLTITITDPTITTNLPVALNDLANTFIDVPVAIDVLANDNTGNTVGTINSTTVAIGTAPTNGGTVIDGTTGIITYTPDPGFVGTDTFTYTVQDSDGRTSAPATVTVNVYPAASSNIVTASDDYNIVSQGSFLTVNAANGLLANDSQIDNTDDLEATAGTFTNAGQGVLVLATDGSYTFTPEVGFVGTTQFVYTVSGTDGAIASGTAYFTVSPRIVPDVNVGFIDLSIPGNLSTNDLVETGTTYGNIVEVGTNPNNNVPVLAADGSYTFITDIPGVYQFSYEVCSPSMTSPDCYVATLTISVTDPAITTNLPIANNDVAVTTANADLSLTGTPVTINAASNDQAGNPNNVIDPTTATLVGTPTGVVNNNDGTFTYTPPAGFVGTFTFEYTIQDDESRTSAPATVTVIVYPSTSPNVLIAADDYYAGLSTAVISTGNVLNNDTQLFGGAVAIVSNPGTFTLTGGELTLNANGTFTFIPNPTFQGVVSHTYTAEGTDGATGSATIYFTIYSGLEVVPDIGVAFKDKEIEGSVATNDLAPAGSIYSTVTVLANANLSLNADGTYTFIATAAGVYTYNVEVCAPTNPPGCDTKTLTITVTDPAITTNPPVANNDVAITYADADPATNAGQLVVINVLENDKAGNVGGSLNPASVAEVGGPLDGLTNNNDGTFNYTPPIGQFPGEVSFQYSVSDGTNTTTATAFITIYPASSPNIVTPADDYYSSSVSAAITGDVLINDTQLDGTTALQVNNPGTINNASGSLELNADGTFTFTPSPSFSGTTSFVYTALGSDGATGSGTLHISVNGGLIVNPDINVAFKDESINGSVATNDVVPVGSTFSNTTGAIVGATLTLDPATGAYTFEATVAGVYVYDIEVCAPTTPPGCETKTLTITVTDPALTNNPPVANNDLAVTYADADPLIAGVAVAIDVAANDQAGNNGGTIDPTTVAIGTAPANGSTSIDAVTGVITYTPAAGFTGTDTFTYTINDTGGNGPSTATVFVTVYAASTPNVVLASDDYLVTTSTSSETINVLANDTQLDGTTPLFIPAAGVGTFSVTGGSVEVAADGTLIFTPNPSFNGTTSYTYTTEGTDGATASGTVYFTVYGGLIINPDIGVAFVDETIEGNVSTNDVVPAGTTYAIDGAVSIPGGAVVTFGMNPDGSYSFTTDIPGVYIYDIEVCAPTTPPGCETKTITITVTDPALTNNPPVANNDLAVTYADADPLNAGVAVAIDVAANDQAGNNGGTIDPTTVTIGTAPANGSTSINAVTGVITYTPAAGFTGTDTFTYSINDTGGNGPSTATVFVTVYPASTPNVVIASDDYTSTSGITPVSGSVLTNDTQLSGAALTTVTNPGSYAVAGLGTLLLNADGTFTFTPVAGAEGVAGFPYTVEGTDGATANATLYVSVYPPLTYTWTGNTDDNWCNPLNWDRGAIPTAGVNVVIPATAIDPEFDFTTCPVCINNLTIASGVTVGLTGKLCVTGDLESEGDVVGAGSIALEGTTLQTITGEFNINNLELNNLTGGATITAGAGNMVNITESIKLTAGALTTNDNLRLISDASGDAYFAPISDAECAVVSIIGNVRVQKFVDGGNRAFRFIAHPFNNTLSLQQIRDYVHITGEGLDFNSTGNPSAFWYVTADGNQAEQDEDTGWVPVSSTNIGEWSKGRAVRMMFRGPRTQGGVVGDDNYNPLDVTYELIGPVNLCSQTLVGLRRVGAPGAGTTGNSAFNFIGNPFPAAINLKTIPAGSRTNIGANYYVWEPRTGVQSGQTVFNTGAGRGGRYVAEPFAGGTAALGQLATGTGFFVVADVDLAEITFTEANKLAQKQLSVGAAVTFREDGDIASRYGANSLQLAIDVNGEQIDRVLVYFDAEANAKVDNMDATKFENPAVNFFTVSEDDFAMAIDRRPWVEDEEYRIPLHILSPAVKYTLKVPDFDLDAGRVLQLHDRHLDKLITLEKGTTYEFEVTADQATKGHRFDIVMGVEVITSIGKNADRFQAFLLPNPAQQQVMVSIQRPDEIADTHVRLVDVRGVMLYETTIKATDDAQISYEVGSLAKGVYLVEITHGNQRIVKRLMVN